MFETQIQPRFSETDAIGHISNTVVPVWFVEGREPLVRLFNPDMTAAAVPLALVRMEIDFLKELHFGNSVTIKTRLTRIGNSSFTVAQEGWQNGHCCVKGIATLVHFDKQASKARPIPDTVRQRLEQHLEPQSSGN